MMNWRFKLCGLLILALTVQTTFASETQEKIYLLQLLNQLNAMQPMISAAEKAQVKGSRIQFHYTNYRTSDGKLRHGLLDDIAEIKAGIKERLEQLSIEPRQVMPIKGDYVNASGFATVNTQAIKVP